MKTQTKPWIVGYDLDIQTHDPVYIIDMEEVMDNLYYSFEVIDGFIILVYKTILVIR